MEYMHIISSLIEADTRHTTTVPSVDTVIPAGSSGEHGLQKSFYDILIQTLLAIVPATRTMMGLWIERHLI